MLNSTKGTKGILEKNRKLLITLHRGTSGPFTPHEAATLLHLDIDKTRKFLAYLADKGWLTHVRRGLYTTVSLDVIEPASWKEDPWIIASKVFQPFYIGGWTACEHWGLTEQIFKETVVISSRPVRRRHMEIQCVPFIVKVVNNSKIFGTEAVWRGRTRVPISDPARTVIDILDDPYIGGGVRHIADVLQEYLSHTRRNDKLLLEYAHKLGNRSVFKRLGYLLELMNVDEAKLIEECRKSISSGISLLDPTATHKGRIIRKWNLRINVTLDSAKGEHLDKQNRTEREGSGVGS
jgi:predicted transcriptional regulator of viral defense system